MRKITIQFVLATIFLLTALSQSVMAYDYLQDGIYYNRLNPYELEVTYSESTYNTYEGDIYIPNYVTINEKTYEVSSIGENAFRNCAKLSSVVLPSTLVWIKDNAFNGCINLNSISIPYGVTQLGNNVFANCNTLSNVSLPNSLTTLGIGTFANCISIASIEIPESITTLEGENFSGCLSLEKIVLPNTLKKISGTFVFGNCQSLKTIKLTEGLTEIGSYSFSGSGLYSIVIPNSVTTIQNAAFNGCLSLAVVVFGTGLQQVRYMSFYGCPSLSKIFCFNTYPPELEHYVHDDWLWYGEYDVFDESHYSTISIYVPYNCLSYYQSANYWNRFSSIEEFDTNSFDDSILNPPLPPVYEINGHEYIDLGLPSGNLWATCNVGANSKEESGYYFAFGETEPKELYLWSNYKYANGSKTTITKYCSSSDYGTVDNKTKLDNEDDAAFVNWGSAWHTPTREEGEELVNSCSWTWMQVNGRNGYKVTGPNGNSIFLPASGYMYYYVNQDNVGGEYMESSYIYDTANILGFYESWHSAWGWCGSRCQGYTVRPVALKEYSGIESPTIMNASTKGIYNLGGIKTDKLSRGLNIIKQSDGTTKKVWIK
ncbi:MAG: leucine-rich repeat domain-containing protein [Prevotella sp.]|nr:leucine-rich repeat domain-containing protein [Prevotella sp.]